MSIKDDLRRSLDRLNLEERRLLDCDHYVSGWNAALEPAAEIARRMMADAHPWDIPEAILRLKLDKD